MAVRTVTCPSPTIRMPTQVHSGRTAQPRDYACSPRRRTPSLAGGHGNVDDATLEQLRAVGTAAAWSAVTNAGIRHPVPSGVAPPSGPETMPLVGRARTLGYLPVREDLLALMRAPGASNPQRTLFESVGPRDVVVIDAGGNTGAGGLGDILATRLKFRGIAGLVRWLGTGRTVHHAEKPAGVHACRARRCKHRRAPAVRVRRPDPVRRRVRLPGDAILGDEDGVVGIPAALARRVADEATEQEHLGGFLRRVVEAGEPLSEAYPPSPRIRADHEQLRAARDPRGT